MNIYKQAPTLTDEVDEYEYFSSTIQQIQKEKLDVLLNWEKTLNEDDKRNFTNLSKMRRVKVKNCTHNTTTNNVNNDNKDNNIDNINKDKENKDLNENIDMFKNLNLGTVPRRIISIKRTNNTIINTKFEIENNNNK